MKKTITALAFILSAIFLQGQTTIKQSAIAVQGTPADTDRIVGWRSTTGNPSYNYTLPALATYFSGKVSGIAISQTTSLQAALDAKQATLNSGSTVTIGTANLTTINGLTASKISDGTAAGRALFTAADLDAQKTILGITGGGGGGTWGSITGTLSAQTDLQAALDAKQAALNSGTNIKTINSVSLLGSGDIVIASGGGSSIPGMISLWPTVNMGSLPSGWQASDGTNGTTSVSGTTGTTAVTLLNTTSATPTFSPVAGTYGSTQSVTISADAGYTIRYNTTGAPTRASTLYTAPVSVATSSTLYAVAYKDPSLLSAVGSAAYVIGTPAPGFVGELGRYANADNTATTVINASSAVAAGNDVAVFIGWVEGATQTIGSVSDARGNTYAIHVQPATGYRRLGWAQAHITTPIQAGDAITVTWGTPGNTYRTICAFQLSNCATTGQPDATAEIAISYGTTCSAPITTVATNTVALCALQVDGSTTISGGAWTQSGAGHAWADGAKTFYLYAVNSSAGVKNPGGTYDAAINSRAALISFK